MCIVRRASLLPKKEETTSQHAIEVGEEAIQSHSEACEEEGMKKRAQSEHGRRHVTPAARSVFHDLGFDAAEAQVLEMRADLMAVLRKLSGARYLR